MYDDVMDDERRPPRDWATIRLALLGVGFLCAWLAMLWFMFKDVL